MELCRLNTRCLGRRLVCLEEVDSTNNYAKDHLWELPHGAVVTTRRQTAGKGRLGRRWQDAPGHTLPFTVVLHGLAVERLPQLPLVAGMGVCRGLERLCGLPLALKWSNDVLASGKKLCGILAESRVSAQSTGAVLGIGVNVRQTRLDFQALNLVYATSLFAVTQKYYNFSEICTVILEELEPLLEILQKNGFGPLREQYKSRCVNLGRQALVTVDGEERRGVCLDIADDGSLVCGVDGRLVHIAAGEASVRGIYGHL